MAGVASWVAVAVGVAGLIELAARLVPQRTVVLPWFLPTGHLLLAAILIFTAILATCDATIRRHARSLPMAGYAVMVAALAVLKTVTFPGVIPGGLPGVAPQTTALMYSAMNIARPALLAMVLFACGRELRHPRRAAATAIGSGLLLGVLVAAAAVLLAPVLPLTVEHGSFTTFSRALGAVALLPGLGAIGVFLVGRRGDPRIAPSVAAALVLLLFQQVAAFFVGARFEPAWYAQNLLFLLPAPTLLLGQVVFYRRSVAAEVEGLHRTQALYVAAAALGITTHPDTVLDTVVQLAAEGLSSADPADTRSSMFRLEGNHALLVAEHDPTGESYLGMQLAVSGHKLMAAAIRDRAVVTGQVAPIHAGVPSEDHLAPAFRQGAFAPVVVDERVVGVLSIRRRSNRAFTLAERGQLAAFAQLASVALVRADAVEKLEAQQAAATASERRLQSILDNALDAVVTMDGEGLIVGWSLQAERIFGWPAEEVIGRSIAQTIVPERLRAAHIAGLARYHATGEGVVLGTVIEMAALRRDGSEFPVELAVSARPDPGPSAVFTAFVRDITARKRQEEELVTALAEVRASRARLAETAATDVLTGLPNRREFDHRIGLPQAAPFAVLAIDVDNLKVANDTHGHEAGDEVIRAVARTLRMTLRSDDLVARTGGDEFAVLLARTTEADAAQLADRLRLAMHGVVLPRGQARISVGAAGGRPGDNVTAVWARADEALLRAKRSGRDRFETTTEAARERLSPVTRWESVLPRLLAPQGIRAVYQPIVDLRSGAIWGFEALARPAEGDDDMGVHSLFTAAERLGVLRDLDWVCRRAALHHGHELPAGLPLFINVGAGSLLDPVHPVDQMVLLARWASRPASEVVLEITEREAIRDLDRLRVVVAEYRAERFRFALDDVGEGHSTFEVLAAARPEFVKLGRRLSQTAPNPGAEAVIAALIAYATRGGARLIAEGVETTAQARLLTALGIELAQGFVFHRPAPASRWADQDGALSLPARGRMASLDR